MFLNITNVSHVDNLLESALTTKRVFTHDTTLFGLPTSVFILGVALMFTTFFLLEKVLGVVLGILYFKMMYAIHEEDPKALQVWIHALKHRKTGWCASKINRTEVIRLS